MSRGPLSGITVIEIAGIGPAPFVCGQLEDMGASVVRVDRAGGSSSLPPAMSPIGDSQRLTVSLNLKDDADRQIAVTLIAHADVLIDPYRPGVTERLGIGPVEMCDNNQRLVYARMTGWGQEGPYAQMAGHDINYIGLTGALAAIGPSDAPTPPLNLVGDYGGGAMFAVSGILAALVERASTGFGQVIDVAMVDGAGMLFGPIRDLHDAGLWASGRQQNFLDGGAPFYTCYRTADGEFMAVGALEPRFYGQLVSGLGLDEDDLGDRLDRAQWPRITAVFAEVFATRTRDEWTRIFDGTDACVTPVLGMDEVASHPHNAERGALVTTAAGTRPHPAPRFQRSGHSNVAPTHDEASVSDLLSRLGLEHGDIAGLIQDATVRWT